MAPQHGREFRQKAMRAALTSGLSRKQVASDFGVGLSTLSRWIQLESRELPDEAALYEDAAYSSKERRAKLERFGIKDRVLREGCQNRKPQDKCA